MDAKSILDMVVEAAGSWRSPTHRAGLAKVPQRGVVIVTCMDARIDAPNVHGLDAGQAHVIRNAGAIVTDDVERSVLLSQWTLRTSTVFVVGHTDCGLLGHDEDATVALIEASGRQAPSMRLGSLASVERGVRDGVERLRASGAMRHVDDVHGLVHDVGTGEFHHVA